MKRSSGDDSAVKRRIAALLLSFCGATALADDPCRELVDHYIQINANGYEGVIGHNGINSGVSSDGAVFFELWT